MCKTCGVGTRSHELRTFSKGTVLQDFPSPILDAHYLSVDMVRQFLSFIVGIFQSKVQQFCLFSVMCH